MTTFHQYASCYDLLYRDKDYEGEAAFVANLIHEQIVDGKSILEFGCGTGLHALALARLGYSVRGVDLSHGMIKEARKHLSNASLPTQSIVSFEQADIRSLCLPQKFDAVIALFHVMSYQTTDSDVEAAMTAAAEHLRPDGIFIFDYWYGPAVVMDPPTTRVRYVENQTSKVTRMARPQVRRDEHIVNVAYEISIEACSSGKIDRVFENHPLRYFFEPELCCLLENVGLEVLKSGEWLTSRPPSDQRWSAYAVSRLRPRR
jgi:SAM-dependent methyltransferase